MELKMSRCPDCSLDLVQTGKDTITGREIREYRCPKCGRDDWIDHGKAIWATLHDDGEKTSGPS